ncbi:MAG: tetratricopeptide repeat protein [Pyrinomonadaceae bacterium]
MKLAIICLAACFAFGCNAAKPVVQSNNSATVTKSPEKSQTAIAHSSENQTPAQTAPPASGEKSKWTASGDPIDTTAFDSAIMAAEKAAGGKPAKALGDAYYKRAVALTEARQYASALGDYRRAVKNDPANAEAKDWIDKIIMIYDGLNKSSPKEGEEPPPLPFKK